MGKTSNLTGTGKKNLKKQQKAQGHLAEQAVKEAKALYPHKKSALGDLEKIQKGKGAPEYKPKTKYEPSKFKPETNYEHRTLTQLTKDFERAGRGAEKIFEPIKQNALAEFHQNVLPGINNSLGSESKSSSALNQAIAAAGGNLQRGLASDFASLQTNLAGNLLGQREQQRQFGAQFGAGQEQFYNQMKNQQQQFGSQFGAQQEQNIYNSQLQALQARLNANNALLGNPTNPNFSPIQSSYNQQAGGAGGPTIGQRYAGSVAGGAAGAATGFAFGGPPGAVIGGFAGGLQGLQLGQ